jgi:hypothetical protein
MGAVLTRAYTHSPHTKISRRALACPHARALTRPRAPFFLLWCAFSRRAPRAKRRGAAASSSTRPTKSLYKPMANPQQQQQRTLSCAYKGRVFSAEPLCCPIQPAMPECHLAALALWLDLPGIGALRPVRITCIRTTKAQPANRGKTVDFIV